LATDLSRHTVVPVPSAGILTTSIVFPVFTIGRRSTPGGDQAFAGIEVPASQQACVIAISRFSDPAAFPVLLETTLSPDWRTRPLHETLPAFEPAAGGWHETYAAPEMLPHSRQWLSHLARVTSAPTFKSPQVTRVDADGIEVRGHADTAAAYLLSWPYLQREPGSVFFVDGEIHAGGLLIGLQQDEQWVQTLSVIRPGRFTALIQVQTSGSYRPVIANLQRKSLYHHSAITRYGWLPSPP
jgi:hypothetical protein